MPQKEYDAFLQSLKQWIADNQEDFDEFEEMMANEPEQGYFSILQQSTTYLPTLKKMAAKKLNSPDDIELSDIIKVVEESGLAQKILATFDNKGDISFIPAMLCWLYYGRSFEGMVEFGEQIIENPKTSKLEKLKTLMMLKLLVWYSKKLKIRTKESWAEYYKLRKVIGDTSNLDWAMEGEQPVDNVKPQTKTRSKDEIFLIGLISDNLEHEQQEELIDMMKRYMLNHKVYAARYTATMILALRKLNYLKSHTNKNLYNLLRSELKLEIGRDNMINEYLNQDNSSRSVIPDEVESAVLYFQEAEDVSY